MSAAFGTTLVAGLAAMFALWGLSLARRDASIADIWWGPGFVWLGAVALSLSAAAPTPRAWLALALVALWGLRLGAYLFWRNAGGEDPRYQAMRRHWGARFPIVSLATVFAFQGVLQWIVSWPLQAAVLAPGPGALGALDALGAALFALGFTFESVGDAQLARFRADPANAGRVMDRGLWRYTRHPNYFGDCCVWWGLAAIALATPFGAWTLLGPALMTLLLLRVSGVALLERSIARRRPEYSDYIERTSAFVPLPPRRTGK